MWDKIKAFFSSVVGAIVLVLTAVVAILAYILSNKRKEVNALKAKIDLVETQKQADLLEVEIKQRMANKEALSKEVQELQRGLDSLEERRKQIASDEKNKNPDEVEDFWRNN
jgi:septal ring factor EnvC (AmiA/AmiB activator)